MATLYRVRFERLMELTDEEAEAILAHSDPIEADDERYIVLDFEDNDKEIQEMVEDLRRRVRPEVLEAVKRIASECGSFVIQ